MIKDDDTRILTRITAKQLKAKRAVYDSYESVCSEGHYGGEYGCDLCLNCEYDGCNCNGRVCGKLCVDNCIWEWFSPLGVYSWSRHYDYVHKFIHNPRQKGEWPKENNNRRAEPAELEGDKIYEWIMSQEQVAEHILTKFPLVCSRTLDEEELVTDIQVKYDGKGAVYLRIDGYYFRDGKACLFLRDIEDLPFYAIKNWQRDEAEESE